MQLLVIMIGSFREGPSSRSKRGVVTLKELSAWYSYDRKEFNKEDFDKSVIVY